MASRRIWSLYMISAGQLANIFKKLHSFKEVLSTQTKYENLTTVEQEIECYFYMFAHYFLTISAMLQIEIRSCGEKQKRNFENKNSVEFCIVFDFQERQKMHILFIVI